MRAMEPWRRQAVDQSELSYYTRRVCGSVLIASRRSVAWTLQVQTLADQEEEFASVSWSQLCGSL